MYFTTVYFLRRRLFFDDGLGVIEAIFDPFYITFDAYAANPLSLSCGTSFEKLFLSLDYAEVNNPLSVSFKPDFDDTEINVNLVGHDAKSAHTKTDLDFIVKEDYLLNMSPPLPVRYVKTFTGNLYATVGNVKSVSVSGEIEVNVTMFTRMLLIAMKYIKFESEYFVSMDVNDNLYLIPIRPIKPSNVNLGEASYEMQIGFMEIETIKAPNINLGETSYETQIGFIESEAIEINESFEMDFTSTVQLLGKIPLSYYTDKTLYDLSGTNLSDMKYVLNKIVLSYYTNKTLSNISGIKLSDMKYIK